MGKRPNLIQIRGENLEPGEDAVLKVRRKLIDVVNHYEDLLNTEGDDKRSRSMRNSGAAGLLHCYDKTRHIKLDKPDGSEFDELSDEKKLEIIERHAAALREKLGKAG